MIKLNPVLLFIFISFICWTSSSEARSRGGGAVPSLFNMHSVGMGLSYVGADQIDLNEHLAAANDSSSFANAYELDANYQYRIFDSLLAVQLRASYFLQTANQGSFDYQLKGYTIFPVLKYHLKDSLENRFYTMLGYGYGSLRGELDQPAGGVDFEGNAYGILVGAGAEFCFSYYHCLVFEGIYRALPIQKSLSKYTNGNPQGLSQYTVGREVEYGGQDLETTMSGLVGRIGYQFSLDWIGIE